MFFRFGSAAYVPWCLRSPNIAVCGCENTPSSLCPQSRQYSIVPQPSLCCSFPATGSSCVWTQSPGESPPIDGRTALTLIVVQAGYSSQALYCQKLVTNDQVYIYIGRGQVLVQDRPWFTSSPGRIESTRASTTGQKCFALFRC